MQHFYQLLICLIIFSSCSIFQKRDKSRDIQTEVLAEIYKSTPDIKLCIENEKELKELEAERIRLTVMLKINHQGQIDSFSLKESIFPQSLGECIFKTLDKVTFPKFAEFDSIEITQPFIFSLK